MLRIIVTVQKSALQRERCGGRRGYTNNNTTPPQGTRATDAFRMAATAAAAAAATAAMGHFRLWD